MVQRQVAPYGSWKSLITPDLIVAGVVQLGQVQVDGDDVYWVESRPTETGRAVVVVRRPDGTVSDVTPQPFYVRTRVHEYGGGAYLVADGTVFFSNFTDNRLYVQPPGTEPRPLTPEAELRYADFILDQPRNRLIAVREDHRGTGEAINTIAAVALDGEDEQAVLAAGHDFYASPRLSPDGTTLAWLSWNVPHMPWDETELWIGTVAADGAIVNPQLIAGGTRESVFQPEWSPDGDLYFISDRGTGWWNIYRWRDGSVDPLTQMEVEFGVPQWQFGLSTYAFADARRLVCRYHTPLSDHLAILDTASRGLAPLELPYTSISGLRATQNRALAIAGSPTTPREVVQIDLNSGSVEVLRASSTLSADPAYFSHPEAIEFPTDNGQTAHAYYYPPANPEYEAPSGERPPLIVKSHGGPTSSAQTVLDLGIQFWTSRGFAVVDVNYGGSAGYGRAYRERLYGQWGVVDVHDCVNAARYLADRGAADPERLIIVGGSAGGYTTLAALAFTDEFRAGASHFGVADLEQFVGAGGQGTHKFESRYLDQLVGPYPERSDLYRQRSPVHSADRLSCPIILFQGLEDRVVPPQQAERMVEVLREKGIPFAYVAFEGEGHGFRRAETIKRALEAELYFYSRVFGFPLPEGIEPIQIENLPA